MDRLKILTNKEEFLKVFPAKESLIQKVSNIELAMLIVNLKKDTDFKRILNRNSLEEFKNSFYEFFGKPVISNKKFGVINGVFYTDHDFTDTEFDALYKLYISATDFQRKLYELHPTAVKKFMRDNDGLCCGNMLLNCTDAEFIDTLNSIDFPITTVENLLTSLRFDLVLNSSKYGRIRTSNDVFILDIPNSYKECTGVFISKL